MMAVLLWSGCSQVDCEGRYQLDDGRCPCAPGVLPTVQSDGAVTCAEGMVDATPGDAGGQDARQEAGAGDAGAADAAPPCEMMLRYADEDEDGFGDPEQEMEKIRMQTGIPLLAPVVNDLKMIAEKFKLVW